MRIEAYDDARKLPPELSAAWNGMLGPDRVSDGVDATATLEWSAALMESFFAGGGATVLVAHDTDDRVCAVLPLCRLSDNDARLPRGRIALLTDVYCGRLGLPLGDAPQQALSALFDRIERHYPGWNCLQLTTAEGDRTAGLLARAAGERCLGTSAHLVERSPYIELPASFDEYFSTLKPNFRTEVRRGERRLREQGMVERRLFRDPGDVDGFWTAVLAIEKQSWKEAAGTSITANLPQERFYRALLPRAAAAGQLLGTVLYLDGRPIAHQVCLRRDSTVAILKMSYVEDLQRHYPATVLLTMYLRDIIDAGLRYLDFMGTCEDFKMRWTRLTYARTTQVLYRRTVSGRAAYLRFRAARLRARWRGEPVEPRREAGA